MENQAMTTSQGFSPAQAASGGFLEVAKSRAAQEIQAAMVVAKKMPRDTTAAFNRIINDCKRKSLADKAVYAYPRGGQTVTGPSIRLAETLAKNWGNMDAGTVELERTSGVGKELGESTMMAYAWDLETNTRITKVFTVRHKRDTKKGVTVLEDDRDIYELTANQAARRLRACILAVIPGDIVEAAVEQCTKTMAGGDGPLIDRIRAMVTVFSDEFQVSPAMLEKYLRHKLEATSEPELVRMHQIYRALSDGHAHREDYFEVDSTQTAQASGLNQAVAAAVPAAAPQASPAAPAPVTAPVKPRKPKAEAPVAPAPAPADPMAQEAQAEPSDSNEDDVPDFASPNQPTHIHAPEPSPVTTAPAAPAKPPARPKPAAPSPVKATAPAVVEYRFDFGSHGPINGQPGRRPQDLGLEGAKAYLQQIVSHVSKRPEMANDPKIVRAKAELAAFIEASETPGL